MQQSKTLSVFWVNWFAVGRTREENEELLGADGGEAGEVRVYLTIISARGSGDLELSGLGRVWMPEACKRSRLLDYSSNLVSGFGLFFIFQL
jgi:hypothetical protein